MKEAMHILDAQAAAGSGDFSRVLFERSGTVTYTLSEYGKKKFFIAAKFAAPVDGVYKVSLDYRGYVTTAVDGRTAVAYINMYSDGFVLNKFTDSIMKLRHDVDWYYERAIGECTEEEMVPKTIPVLGSLNFTMEADTTSWLNLTRYFYLKKGELVVIGGWSSHASTNSMQATSYFSHRSIKVTY